MTVIKVRFNRTNKYDVQLDAALVRERALGLIFEHADFGGTKDVDIELKSETWLWEQTGNICVEYRHAGKPSGISVTEAHFWVHELRRDDGTVCWLMFPIDRFKELARTAIRQKRSRKNCGDDGLSDVVNIPLRDILK
jgi:hypothetical protein